MVLEVLREQLAALSKEQLIDLLLQKDAAYQELEAENLRLSAEAEVSRMMKGRSPPEWRFRVVSWEERPITFQPRSESQPKTVPGLRLHIRHDDPSEGVPYWDITSKRLIAMLLPLLPGIAGTDTRLEISKTGEGLQSSYSVTVRPA
jgi:hypothetical protein